jgi:hypothetical protein
VASKLEGDNKITAYEVGALLLSVQDMISDGMLCVDSCTILIKAQKNAH